MFNREEDLINIFSAKIQSFLAEILNKPINRHFVIEEFNSNFGVADLVLGTYKPYLSKRGCRESINIDWLEPLIHLKKGDIIDFDIFTDKYNFSKKSARLRFQQYSEAGFITQFDSNCFIVKKEYAPVIDKVIAIEAKLKNWRRALTQAQRYKKFADYTFVLLDKAYAAPALKSINKFKSMNVGLITMDSSNFKVEVLPPEINVKKINYSSRVNEAAYDFFSSTYS